ncbi:alkene reductase [Kitasatospora herbaricolor]|uniref:oxidoreductase n=1 Tax=Kitasatospora herbaricolor TaxID=68217 RepID=UPI0036DF0F98
MPTLFDPLTLRGVTMRNRIWTSPMCQYSVLDQSGVPQQWQLVHLASFAVGGSGLVFTEATGVSPEARISPRDTGIWNDEQRDAWKPIVEFIASQGAVPGIQLGHAGRKASSWPAWGFTGHTGTVPVAEGGWTAVAPSPEAFGDLDIPRELDLAGIDAIVDDFRTAARRAVEAGFRAIELHAAHGYLLHQFLSPVSNQRDDDYGQSPDARARFVVEVATAVTEAIGAGRVGIRLSPMHNIQDVVETDLDDVTATYRSVVDGLAPLGMAYVSVLHRDPSGELVQDLRERFGGAFIVNSGFGTVTTRDEAIALVENSHADAVAVGRLAIANPDLVERWQGEHPENEPDPSTFYTAGAEGYTDYPRLSA